MSKTEDKTIQLTKYLDAIKSQGRTMLLPALLFTQDVWGYIPQSAAKMIGQALKVPLADIAGMIEFYSLLKTTPNGSTHISVCTSPVCDAMGAASLSRQIASLRNPHFTVENVACLGLCDHAPALLVNDDQVGEASIEKISAPPNPVKSSIYGDSQMITQWCDEDIDHTLELFLECGGFDGLDNAFKLSPAEVIETVKRSGLRGRGGAGFPTGLKWESAANTSGETKYLICNQDESEPGTFKDRALLLGDPFKIIEGLIIAAYALRTEKCYFYIRGEYPLAQKVLSAAIDEARQGGYLGKNVRGMGFNFDIEIRRGGGAYICGEETALFESIEGKRGFPRIKPPFPTTSGLFGKPTVINNVETIVNLPLILSLGVEEYRQMGSEAFPGPRLFSVSGDIKRPGVYEIAQPLTLRELIFEMAGGISGTNELQAILLGGAAGKFVPPNNIDLLLTEEILREQGLSLGSGAVMVFDTSRDLRQVLSSLADFFEHESCGKCYPCQLGTHQQALLMKKNTSFGLSAPEIKKLQDVGWTMADASLCGLGQTASFAILSAHQHWPDLFTPQKPGMP